MSARKIIGAGVLVAAAAGFAVAAALGAFGSGSSSATGSHVNAIGIHGQWHIEIRDHGRLVKTLNFHNDTGLGAAYVLPGLLSANNSGGQWRVGLGGLCGSQCDIDENHPGPPTGDSQNLTVTPGALTNPLRGTLVLKGSVITPQSGTLTSVDTAFNMCDSTTEPGICLIYGVASGAVGTDTENFSNAEVTPTPIVAGQQVLVTVTFTISNVS